MTGRHGFSAPPRALTGKPSRKQAKTEPATEAQMKYLTPLADKVGKERVDAEFAEVIKGSDIEPRTPRQRCATAECSTASARGSGSSSPGRKYENGVSALTP